ncbi:MAG: hypothetical protein OHK0039_42890 [Bacteroidia bacterium]
MIEDSEADTRLIEEYLRETGMGWGYVLEQAQSLKQGLAMLTTVGKEIDVVLLDLGLPDSQGLATFEALHVRCSQYPIIVLTSRLDEELGRMAVSLGAQDFLDKFSLNPPLLGHAITYAIERKQMLLRLEKVQEMALIGSWELDIQHNRFRASPQFCRMLQIAPERLTDFDAYLGYVHPEDQSMVRTSLQEVQTSAQPFALDHRLLLADGSVKHVVLQGRLENDSYHHTRVIIGMTQDITERHHIAELTRQKDLAEKAAKLRQDFLAKTSHEIRTPLNPILLLTDFLLQTDLTREQREHLSAIRSAGKTLLAVVNDILDLTKIEAGKVEFQQHRLSIREIFDSVREIMEINVRERGLELLTIADKSLPHQLIGDSVRLTQILLNLVANAVKFTQRGFVRIAATLKSREDDRVWVQFTVSDSGIGIPQDKLKSIFESFQQLDTLPNRQYGGTGLGLTIVKQLVVLQGGTVEVESEVGAGSRFIVELPFAVEDTLLPVETQQRTVVPTYLRQLRILLVEDDELNQMVTVQLFRNWGMTLEVAENGRIALERLSERAYDLVLMDVQMPEMDGYETTRIIRSEFAAPQRDVPIIALTANAFSGSDEACIEAGMNAYLTKPIDARLLLTKIDQLGRQTALTHTHAAQVSATPNGHRLPAASPTDATQSNTDRMSNYQFVNLEYLNEVSGGDAFMIRKIVNKFIETAPGMLDNLDRHLTEQSYQDLSQAAHKIKSSLGFLGIESVKETIERLEKMAKSGDRVAEYPRMVSEVRSITEAAIAELHVAIDTL